MIHLRPYQQESIDALREGIRAGHRTQILCAPTGAGKTVMGAFLLQEVDRKGTRAAFIVDRVALTDQTSQTLQDYGIPHGIAQGANTCNRRAPIQVCSAQTIEKRGWLPEVDLLIVDEAHGMRKAIMEFVTNSSVPVVGLTATPFTPGLGKVYTNVVNVTTTDQLIADGFLAPLRVYSAREIDMKGAKTVAGEWTGKEVERRGNQIVGDIVSEWVAKTNEHFGGPVKTIVFSATVGHGEELCRQFQAAGYCFEQISYKDANDKRRKMLIEEFRRADSDIVGLVSCEALAKGFDVPDIRCGVCARPYRKSFASHIQQIGRAMRSAPGKEFALWLDHAGNYLGFYDQMVEFFANGVQSLDEGERHNQVRKEEGERDPTEMRCSWCGYVMSPKVSHCPACGKERVRRNKVASVAGEMVAVEREAKSHTDHELWRQVCRVAVDRKDDIETARKFALAQYRNMVGAWPDREWGFSPVPPEQADPVVAKRVRHQIIKWAKSRGRRAA